MYNRYDIYMKQGVRDEAAYIKTGLEEDGDVFLSDRVGDATSSRITLLGKDGQVLFDSIENPEEMENHSNRPEFIEAEKQGSGEMVRYSDTLSKQTFYYAVKLKDDQVLRVARTTDSLLVTMLTSFLLLGGLVCVILVIELFLVQKQTRKLIEPINRIDLEHPLEHVCYEELRPLLFRLDQQNRQIQKQLEDLKNAESARKEFTANVSHELKTPLTIIDADAEVLEMDFGENEWLSDIQNQTKRLTDLTNNLILLARMEEESMKLPMVEFPLSDVAEEVIGNFQTLAKAQNKFLHGKIQPMISMKGDEKAIRQLIGILLDNAVKYSDEKGEILLTVEVQRNHIFLSVFNTTEFINKKEIAHLFERFYRADKSRNSQTGGYGIGLSIAAATVRANKGKISAITEDEKSLRITAVFPNGKK